MKKVKKKYTAIVIGASYTSLLAATVMSKHGASILIIEKNENIGGKITPFSFYINERKYFFNNEFFGFHTDSYNYNKIFDTELNLINKIDKYYPKYKLIIFNQNNKYEFLNSSNKYYALLKTKFPLRKEKIQKFIEIINNCKNNPLLIKSLSNKYYSTYEFLCDYFNDNIIKEVFNSLTFFSGLSLKTLDTGFFIYSYINFMHSSIYYPKKGIFPIINWLVNELKMSSGNISTNSEALYGMINKNKIATFKLNIHNKSQIINGKKYIIGLNYIYFITKILKLKGNYLKQYKNLYLENLNFSTKIKIYFKLKNNRNISNIMKSYHYFINENSYYNIDKYNFDLNTTLIRIINASNIQKYDENITNYFLAEILVPKGDLIKIKNNKEEINAYYNNIISKIKSRVFKVFNGIEDFVEHIFIKDIFSESKLINNYDFSYNGIIQNKQNAIGTKSMLTPFHNTYIASKYSSPGCDISNAYDSSYNIYHAFDINFRGYDFSIIDILNYEEFFNMYRINYKYNKKYKNMVIGFHLDHEVSFIMQLTEEKLLIKQCTFDESFGADIYVYCNFGILKNIIQKRISMTREVIANNFRVKGGVWLLQRILRRTNMYHFKEEDLKKLFGHVEKIYPTSKLSQEKKNK